MKLAKIKQDLERLEKLVNKACGAAFDQREVFKNEAINFADLGCTECVYCIDKNGIGHFQVTVEEAAPESAGLQAFISAFLTEHGFSNVVVLTEW